MRSFAKYLEIDPGDLSRIMTGKITIGSRLASKLADRLELDNKEKALFVASATHEQANKELSNLNLTNIQQRVALDPTLLDSSEFSMVSDIEHYAVLEMTYLKDFSSDPKWIAKKLGISTLEAKLVIARLLASGLLIEVDGKLVKNKKTLHTPLHTTGPALKRHFEQVLKRASTSLLEDPVATRNMSGMTIPIDPTKVAEAKTLIADFSQQLCEFLSAGDKTRVYQLAVCLFPLDLTSSTGNS